MPVHFLFSVTTSHFSCPLPGHTWIWLFFFTPCQVNVLRLSQCWVNWATSIVTCHYHPDVGVCRPYATALTTVSLRRAVYSCWQVIFVTVQWLSGCWHNVHHVTFRQFSDVRWPDQLWEQHHPAVSHQSTENEQVPLQRCSKHTGRNMGLISGHTMRNNY